MKPIDILNMGPTRTVTENQDGTYTIKIVPPSFMGGSGGSITLNKKQWLGYLAWQNGELIQRALPDLTPSQRELILTGLNDEEFFEATYEEDDVV